MAIEISSNLSSHLREEVPSLIMFEYDAFLPSFCSFSLKRDQSACLNLFHSAIKQEYHRMDSPLKRVAMWVIGGAGTAHVVYQNRSQLQSSSRHPRTMLLCERVYRGVSQISHCLWSSHLFRVGMTVGIIFGITSSHLFKRGVHQLSLRDQAFEHSLRVSHQALAIMNRFLEQEREALEGICSFSHQVIAFGVTTDCNHTFECFALAQKLLEGNEPLLIPTSECPTCHHSISEITYDQKASSSLAMRSVLEKMEMILDQSKIMKEFASHEIEVALGQNISFLGRSEQEIFDLINHNPNDLRPHELFALAAFIFKQFKPIVNRIKVIAEMTYPRILELRREGIIGSHTSNTLTSSLSSWSRDKPCIPKKYKLMRELFDRLGGAS
ncbi:MAG: hypothetical protein QRY72_00170 [Candidatus Rhabdochlamydia sp.]